MKIALLFNQKPCLSQPQAGQEEAFCEWDAPRTIEAVAGALRERHEVIPVDCHPRRLQEIIATLEREKPDLCFNMAEGAGAVSREAQIPALLEMLGLPYTGSDALTLATALDKGRSKEVLSHHGIPTPAFAVIDSKGALGKTLPPSLEYPLIVKPLHEGSSKGIFEHSLATSPAELEREVCEVLRRYSQPALVEAFVPGREFTVGLLGNGNKLEVLPIIEIMFDAFPPGAQRLYGYEAKWIWDTPEAPIDVLRCPADIAGELRDQIEDVCRGGFRALRCRDWARFDVRLDAAGKPQLLEVNPLPGIFPDPDGHAAFPTAARAAGLSYTALIHRVVDLALRRCELSSGG